MLNVTSEVGRLRSVLVHEPGPEVDLMVPAMMEQLLFDDILFGDGARNEHGRFRRVLQILGVESIDALDLLRETLDLPEGREWVLGVLPTTLPRALRERIAAADAEELARILTQGARSKTSRRAVEADDLYDLTPLPNWCFQRDPQVVLGSGLVFCAMGAPARHREALLSRAVFGFHPRFRASPELFDPLRPAVSQAILSDATRSCIEGGDLLVASPEVLIVGLSERTNRTAVTHLAEQLVAHEGGPRWLIAVQIPRRRAYMHLDTLFTFVDRDACLVFPPVLLETGSQAATVYELDLESREPEWSSCADLFGTLSRHGITLDPIPCGGDDPVVQQREQWTDGANALAITPGLLTLYDRNIGTLEELSRRGFEVVRADDLLLGKTEVDVDSGKRVCVSIPSNELSRARGGPHCLSHPLVRDDLD